jgi:hypothetical protein
LQKIKLTGSLKRCRNKGIYINAPDWYFATGSNKTAMGYREENWSLPREYQIVIGRQNIYDGTRAKIPNKKKLIVKYYVDNKEKIRYIL